MDFLLFAVVQRVGVIPSGAAFQAEGGISHPRKAAAFPHPSASSADFLSALCVLRFEAAGKKSTQFEMTLDERYPKFKATHQPHYPALRSPGTFGRFIIPLKREGARAGLDRLQFWDILRHRRAQFRELARRNQHPVL